MISPGLPPLPPLPRSVKAAVGVSMGSCGVLAVLIALVAIPLILKMRQIIGVGTLPYFITGGVLSLGAFCVSFKMLTRAQERRLDAMMPRPEVRREDVPSITPLAATPLAPVTRISIAHDAPDPEPPQDPKTGPPQQHTEQETQTTDKAPSSSAVSEDLAAAPVPAQESQDTPAPKQPPPNADSMTPLLREVPDPALTEASNDALPSPPAVIEDTPSDVKDRIANEAQGKCPEKVSAMGGPSPPPTSPFQPLTNALNVLCLSLLISHHKFSKTDIEPADIDTMKECFETIEQIFTKYCTGDQMLQILYHKINDLPYQLQYTYQDLNDGSMFAWGKRKAAGAFISPNLIKSKISKTLKDIGLELLPEDQRALDGILSRLMNILIKPITATTVGENRYQPLAKIMAWDSVDLSMPLFNPGKTTKNIDAIVDRLGLLVSAFTNE